MATKAKPIRVAMAQIDLTVGRFDHNVSRVKECYEKALKANVRILLVPELALCGYPAHDLLLRPEMIDRTEAALEQLKTLTSGQKCAIAVGHVAANPANFGPRLLNQVSVIEDGQVVFEQAKSLIPTYDVFDEDRYFERAQVQSVWICDGHKIAFAICEDLWFDQLHQGRYRYGVNPIENYVELGAEIVLSISASPYEWGKLERRRELFFETVHRYKVPLVYLNQVGANDEILFDGGSFAFSGSGEMTGRLPLFRETLGIVDWEPETKEVQWVEPNVRMLETFAPKEIEILSRALVLGIEDYFRKTGFETAIVGLSGGLDSSVVAALAVHALGEKHVIGVSMPSQFSSSHSRDDAEALAKKLMLRYETRPIKFVFATLSRELSEGRGKLKDIAIENLQSRLRGLTLMTLANHENALVLTTGNKSEFAMGYATQYGDLIGAIAPIGDVFKMRVYELAEYLNEKWGNPIPQSVLDKPPSAELRPDQKDTDSLPEYRVLDPLLEDYIEKGLPYQELVRRHYQAFESDAARIQKILRTVELNEYKRRQSPIVLKVSPKAFGIGRRIPIAKVWDQSIS